MSYSSFYSPIHFRELVLFDPHMQTFRPTSNQCVLLNIMCSFHARLSDHLCRTSVDKCQCYSISPWWSVEGLYFGSNKWKYTSYNQGNHFELKCGKKLNAALFISLMGEGWRTSKSTRFLSHLWKKHQNTETQNQTKRKWEKHLKVPVLKSLKNEVFVKMSDMVTFLTILSIFKGENLKNNFLICKQLEQIVMLLNVVTK